MQQQFLLLQLKEAEKSLENITTNQFTTAFDIYTLKPRSRFMLSVPTNIKKNFLILNSASSNDLQYFNNHFIMTP